MPVPAPTRGRQQSAAMPTERTRVQTPPPIRERSPVQADNMPTTPAYSDVPNTLQEGGISTAELLQQRSEAYRECP